LHIKELIKDVAFFYSISCQLVFTVVIQSQNISHA